MTIENFINPVGVGLTPDLHDINWLPSGGSVFDSKIVLSNAALDITGGTPSDRLAIGAWGTKGARRADSTSDIGVALIHGNAVPISSGGYGPAVRASATSYGYSLNLVTPVLGRWTLLRIMKNGAYYGQAVVDLDVLNDYNLMIEATENAGTVTLDTYIDDFSTPVYSVDDDGLGGSGAIIPTGNPGVYLLNNTSNVYTLTDWADVAIIVSADITGTVITGGVLESEIVTGSETIIITLTDDAWALAGTGPIGSTADSQALLDGLVGTIPATGWNDEVSTVLSPSDLVRTSNQIATITLPACAGYSISADEPVTLTIPNEVLVLSANDIVASPVITIGAEAALVYETTITVTGGESLTGFDYEIFSGQDLNTRVSIGNGSGLDLDVNGSATIDISTEVVSAGLSNGDPLMIEICDWTTTPAVDSNSATCTSTVTLV